MTRWPRARVALALLVVTAYALVAWALLVGPPPLALTGSVLFALVTTVHLGVFFLNLGVFVDVTSRGLAGRDVVALTFDDGPHPVHTRRVLELLDAHGARATFFVVGEKVSRHPELVAEIVARGHELGLHGHTHDRLLNVRSEARIIADVEANRRAIEAASGVRPTLFRPPVGLSSPRTRTAVRALELRVVGWSARAYDGAGRPSAEQVVSRIARDLSDGAIVLLHDAAERGDAEPASVAALPALLARIEACGLRPVSVGELLGTRPATATVTKPATAPDPAAC